MKRFSKKSLALALCLVLAMSITAIPTFADTESGLIAHYNFDGDFKDSVGGNDGTKTGAVSFADDGVFGKCALFNAGFLNVNPTPSFNFGSSYTISVWVKSNEAPLTDINDRFILSRAGDPVNVYEFKLHTPTEISTVLALEEGPGTADSARFLNTTEKWTHLVFKYDGSNLYSYADGQLKSTTPLTAVYTGLDHAIANKITSSDKNIVIGGNASGTDYFNGRMDDLRIYNRAISDDEVAALYTAAMGQYNGKIILKIGSGQMTVGTQEVAVDPASGYTQPVIENGRTLVPIRAIIEAMGGTIGWEASTREVSVSLKGTAIKMKLDSSVADVNGKSVSLDVPAKSINNRTMVPLRFVIENLGAKVQWEGQTQTITILYSK